MRNRKQEYSVIRKLGQGSYASVYLASINPLDRTGLPPNGTFVAIKVISRLLLRQQSELLHEIHVLKQMKNEFVVRFMQLEVDG